MILWQQCHLWQRSLAPLYGASLVALQIASLLWGFNRCRICGRVMVAARGHATVFWGLLSPRRFQVAHKLAQARQHQAMQGLCCAPPTFLFIPFAGTLQVKGKDALPTAESATSTSQGSTATAVFDMMWSITLSMHASPSCIDWLL